MIQNTLLLINKLPPKKQAMLMNISRRFSGNSGVGEQRRLVMPSPTLNFYKEREQGRGKREQQEKPARNFGLKPLILFMTRNKTFFRDV